MSLVCHTIVSRYTPQQRDPIIQEVGASDDPWQTESSFGPAQHLHSRPAPCFVPASLDYDEYGMPKATATGSQSPHLSTSGVSQDVSAWYRSLTARGRAKLEEQCAIPHSSPPITVTCSPSSHSSADASVSYRDNIPPTLHKHSWFLSHPTHYGTIFTHKPSTLADLLSRNPPPLPTEPAFRPPNFLAIGPSNKGFTMLERQGWQEGEGLGRARVERKPRQGLGAGRALEAAFRERDTVCTRPVLDLSQSRHATTALLNDVKREVIDLTLSDSEHDSTPEVVDLTLSDSESGDEGDPESTPNKSPLSPIPHGTTLLTPIATTLKADRLGIGLKAARRHHRKAVTHTSAALAAHIRSGNQARKNKARHGRGSRGFARAKRKENQERVSMLAYMNS